MEKVKSIHEGVAKLLTIRKRPVPQFEILPKKDGEYLDKLVWDGHEIPLFDSRYTPRIRAIAKYGNNTAENCALNVYSFEGNDVSLPELIYREMDIAEYVLHSYVRKVTAFVNGASANIIAVMENGTCANMDLGCTMAPGTHNQCQHRLITSRGMCNDRCVPDMTVQHQVNVFGADCQCAAVYDDDEYYLYGLDEVQVGKVLTIHGILTGQEPWEQWANNDVRYRRIVEAVYASDRLGKAVALSEEGEIL